MYLVFSCLGLIGGLLCCTGDILFDLKGVGNEKLGTVCRKINPVRFQDLPGIIMPSLGLAMFGLIGMLNQI